MNRITISLAVVLSAANFSSCDLRSGIARQNMEKYTYTPTPTMSPVPTEAPVDPSEVVIVDTSLDGEIVSVNGYSIKKKADCKEFNRVRINGDRNVVELTGPCRQIIVNGDGNDVVADAALEFVFNGSGNSLRYSRYANGIRPTVIQNLSDNLVEKVTAKPPPDPRTRRKDLK